MKLSEVPHKKVSLDGCVYYISRYPEGDAHIHKSYPRDKDGYGGRIIKFLLEDGTLEKVKGPYCCDGRFNFGTVEKLAKHFNDPSMLTEVTRLVVGKNLFLGTWGGRKRDIYFEETAFAVGDYRDRICPSWSGLELQICVRGGSLCRTARHYDFKHMWE